MVVNENVVIQARRVCPQCGAGDIIKYGKREGLQVYKCKPCNKKFTDNGALPGRRIPPKVVGGALRDFYDGNSLRDVTRGIEQDYGFKPSSSTIYEWLSEYVRLGRLATRDFKADTGDTWVADELVFKADGQKLWLWSVMDARTRTCWLSVYPKPEPSLTP